MKSEDEIIRAHYARLGRKRTKKKLTALALNRVKALEATVADPKDMERAYRAVRDGKASKTHAAIHIAKTRYQRFLAYCARRDAGEPWQLIGPKI